MKGHEYASDLILPGHAQTATSANRVTQNESCPPLSFEFQSITPEIKLNRNTEKVLAFIY